MVPSALLTMGVLCAGMSILVETPIIARRLHTECKPIWRITTSANIASYVLLAACVWFLTQARIAMDALTELFMPLSSQLVRIAVSISRWFVSGSP
jgi:hypothetical protein